MLGNETRRCHPFASGTIYRLSRDVRLIDAVISFAMSFAFTRMATTSGATELEFTNTMQSSGVRYLVTRPFTVSPGPLPLFLTSRHLQSYRQYVPPTPHLHRLKAICLLQIALVRHELSRGQRHG